jgi:hypothetical protein
VSTTRVERGKSASIDQPFAVDGVLTDADGAVTVTITRQDGTALATGAATTKPVGTTGVYRYSLAAQTNLDLLTLTYTGTWSGAVQTEVQHVEIVGDFILSLSECRGLDARFAAAATPLISDADIRRVRAEVEDAIEAEAGAAFVPRYARETISGRGGNGLLLGHTYPRTVRSVRSYTAAATYTAWDSTQLAAITYDDSGLLGSWTDAYTYGTRNLVVEYEHGLYPTPTLIRRAARALFKLKMLEDQATTDPSLANVRSLSVEGYSVSYGDAAGTGSKVADDLIDQWKRSTNPAGVAIA